MKSAHFIILGLIFILLAACQRNNNVCPTQEGISKPALQLSDLIAMTPVPKASSEPIEVMIGGKTVLVDKLVDYPICNDDWSGIVYVSCDAQVAEAGLDANANPLFFEGCKLKIAPNTVVYVAAHHDAAYYKGCSCHTGEEWQP